MSQDGSSQPPSGFPNAKPMQNHTPAPMEGSDYDPLSWSAFSSTAPAAHEPHESQPPVAVESPSKQRIAVVLAASPKREDHGHLQIRDEIAPNPVNSDLPGFNAPNALAASQPVNSTTGPTVQSSGGGRGRPKGWRPGMSYATMRGNSPSTSARRGDSATAAASRTARTARPRPQPQPQPQPQAHHSGEGKRRRGRPPKVSSTPPRDVYRKLSPPLIAYLCEWEGCKAELHNLDTLRRHVHAVHGRRSEGRCRWGRCGGQEQSHRFVEARDFDEHVEKAHLVPLSWYVGDGPRNSLDPSSYAKKDANSVPDFLKDASGRQVTPWVRDQELEDHATWKNNRRKLKELLLRRDQNLPDEGSTSGEDADVKQAAGR